jgi:Tol biopolymer transport system component
MIKRALLVASLATLLMPTQASALPVGDVIVATDATMGSRVAMSAVDGSGKSPASCGGDLTHSGTRYFLSVTNRFDSPVWTELSAHDEDCNWTATLLADPSFRGDFARWSPDGSRIAFGGALTDLGTGLLIERGIYVAEVVRDELGRPAAIAGMRFAVDTPDEAIDFAWVRDGVRVVYAASVANGDGSSQNDLFVASVDGGAPVKLTSSAASEFAPEVSPVADVIAFTKPIVQRGLSGSNIYTMSLSGGTPRLVTTTKNTKTAVNLHPTWSPDGSFIAFSGRSASTNEASDILKVRADGSGKAFNLTQDSNHIYYQPIWRR